MNYKIDSTYLRRLIAKQAWCERRKRNDARKHVPFLAFEDAYHAGKYHAYLEMWNTIRDEIA